MLIVTEKVKKMLPKKQIRRKMLNVTEKVKKMLPKKETFEEKC